MNIQVGQKYNNRFGKTFLVTKVETNVTGYFSDDPYRIISTIHFKDDSGEKFYLDSPQFLTHYVLDN